MRLLGEVPLTSAERQKRYRERHPDRIEEPLTEKSRECQRRRNRAYDERNPGRSVVRNATFRTTTKGAAQYLYSNAKRRAAASGIEFSITKEWILAAVENGKCQVTGIPFVLANGRKPWAPSLDKTNPNSGYTTNNVKVVVWIYNTCKWCFTHEDVVMLAKAVLAGENKCAF